VLVSDECYGVLNQVGDERIPSVLHREVNGGSLEGLLMSSSVSKQSNLAGYRVGYAIGDAELVEAIVTRRRRLGLIMPKPQQELLGAALADDAHLDEQRARHRRRIARLRPAVQAAGLRIDGPTDGMYIWATADEDGWRTATRLAERGVLCMPGGIFGRAGDRHVRFAVSITEDRLDQAIARLSVGP
jgi:aspartate/methionine/tyrosine aminotransferase